MLLQLQTSQCYAADHHGNPKFSRFKAWSGSHMNPDNKNGDESFGAEKRKVYTGPNPLHNR